jgi:hypothetical protein
MKKAAFGLGAALALGAALFVAWTLTGGSESSPVDADEPRPLHVPTTAPIGESAKATAAPVHISVGSYHIPSEQMSGWLAAASSRERPLIEDGVLTFEEYQSAVLETITCFERAGVNVVHFPGYGRGGVGEPGPRLSSRGVYSYVGAVQGTPDKPPAEAAAATAACKAGSAQIEFLWAQHTAPSQVEIQAMRDYMAKCLRDAGATVTATHPSDADLKAAKSNGASDATYWKCQFAAADAFEIDELPG